MKTPEIRIYFSWQLNDEISKPLHELWGKGTGSDSPEILRKYAENYRIEWAKYEAKVLLALVESLGVEFYKDVIDVPCAPWVRHMSDPLMMSFAYSPNQFVDSLTHELCHVLLTDNMIYSINSSEREFDLSERWGKLYGREHDFDALVHIPVHALCKHIYLDVLEEPKRLERDMEDVKENLPYKTAWDYVNKHGYEHVIGQLKQDYAAMAIPVN